MAVLSALITFFFVKPLSHDGMVEEDRLFREYLEANGWDTSQMGLLQEVWSGAEKDQAAVVEDNVDEEKQIE